MVGLWCYNQSVKTLLGSPFLAPKMVWAVGLRPFSQLRMESSSGFTLYVNLSWQRKKYSILEYYIHKIMTLIPHWLILTQNRLFCPIKKTKKIHVLNGRQTELVYTSYKRYTFFRINHIIAKDNRAYSPNLVHYPISNCCYWEWKECSNIKICKCLVLNKTNMGNFQLIEVVGCMFS